MAFRQTSVHPTILAVQERMVATNVKRRNRILYARNNSARLKKNQKDRAHGSDHAEMGETLASSSAQVRLPRGDLSEQSEPLENNATAQKHLSSSHASSATGVGPRVTRLTQSGNSATPKDVIHTGAAMDFPRPPQMQRGTNTLQCPYCYTTLDEKYSHPKRWR